jgi:hypothetical protein
MTCTLIRIDLLLDHIMKRHFFIYTYIDIYRSSINGFRKAVQKAIQFSRAECPELCNKKCCWYCVVVRWKVSSTTSVSTLHLALTHSVVVHPTSRLRVIFVLQRANVFSFAYAVCLHTQGCLHMQSVSIRKAVSLLYLLFVFVLTRNSVEDLSMILLLSLKMTVRQKHVGL